MRATDIAENNGLECTLSLVFSSMRWGGGFEVSALASITGHSKCQVVAWEGSVNDALKGSVSYVSQASVMSTRQRAGPI